MFFIKIYYIKVFNEAYVLIDAFGLRLPTFIERLFNHILDNVFFYDAFSHYFPFILHAMNYCHPILSKPSDNVMYIMFVSGQREHTLLSKLKTNK